LIESELFGHEKGAFTGAIASRPGLFECAHGGTLLLDEISEMPLNMQAKLLRVLEQEKFQRVGGNQTLSVDVRVVTTTNRSLEEDVENGRFRFDLFHRLNVLQIVVPPVRDRKQDIPPLVRHFIECFQDEGFTPIRRISDSAMQFLTNFDWPGNVRQLRNVVHHACVVNTTGTINERDFPAMKPASKLVPAGFENMSLDEIERHVILSTLQKHNGNKTTAAKQLGVTARTLSNKMRRYRELGFLQSSS
jgi:transcriptional regulator with PAS, ATPase and Fis domain